MFGGKTRKRTIKRYRWEKQNPGHHARTVMFKKCGKKCFLGPHQSFPICTTGTCKRNINGLHAAYVRARQYRNKSSKYAKIAAKAKKMLKRKGDL